MSGKIAIQRIFRGNQNLMRLIKVSTYALFPYERFIVQANWPAEIVYQNIL